GGAWARCPPPGPPWNGYSNIVGDPGGRVYAATRFEGIGRWNGSAWDEAWLPGLCNNCPNTFRNASEVFAMLADTRGYKWVGCWGYAMEQFDDSAQPNLFIHHADPASGVDPRHTLAFGAAADSSGGRWFGMDTNNLGVVQPLGL